MTAIAGFWDFGGANDVSAKCRNMLDALSAFGPHGCRVEAVDRLALGRRLWCLLPEDESDRQPLVSQSGNQFLVADLRIDNREELAAELRISARSKSDADILLASLERWGDGCLDRLVGDFAFAWFDRSENRLTLARDPLGQRPLFWHRGDGFIAFASMPVAIQAITDATRSVNTRTLARHLSYLPYVGSESFFLNVNRVEPGHVVAVEAGGHRSRRYWWPERKTLKLQRFEDYVDAYRAELDRAVASRLRGANGIVASHLSGGWDSSAVTATAARLMGGAERVLAYTAVPKGEFTVASHRFGDEGPLARATALLYGNVEHELVETPDHSPARDLDLYDRVFQRPLFNLCNHSWLAEIRRRAASSGATVLLTGEVGNWTISASPNALLATLIKERKWRQWWREARAMHSAGNARLRGVAANSFGPWIPRALWNAAAGLSSAPPAKAWSILEPELAKKLEPEIEAHRLGEAWRPKDSFAHARLALSQMDLGEYRKGVLAGWGIDKRDATSDRRLIEFCLNLPIEMLLKDGVRRPLARSALSDRLPPAVLDARGKGLQAPDWHVPVRKNKDALLGLVEEIGGNAQAAELLDVQAMRDWLRNFPETGLGNFDVMARYRTALLSGLWAGHFILSNSGQQQPPASGPVANECRVE
jgi:asparagine synthase (glutamine-hydrolysing)